MLCLAPTLCRTALLCGTRLLAVVMVWGLIGPSLQAAEPVLLRYGWEADQRHVYRLEIETDRVNEIEYQTGTPTFTVVSAGPDGTKLAGANMALSTRTEAKPGRPRVIRLPGIPFRSAGALGGYEVTLDTRGRVINQRGEAHLPYLLGQPAGFFFEPLPEKAESSWKRSETTTISILAAQRIPSPFRRPAEVRRLNAEEETAFSVQEVTAESVLLRREYSLKTVETVGGEPKIEMTSQGTITFDRGRGVPAKIDYEITFSERDENLTFKLPIKVTARLLTTREVDELDAQRAAAAAARIAPPTLAERDRLLADLKSGDKNRARVAAGTLQPKQPDGPDEELAAALIELLDTDDQFYRQSIAGALENWATAQNVPRLLEALDDKHWPVRNGAIKALGRLRDKRAVEPLVKWLDDNLSRTPAAQALQAIGPAAEDAVLKGLDHENWMVRWEACKILKEIGTGKSLERLETAAASDAGPLVKVTARQAADAIRQRERQIL